MGGTLVPPPPPMAYPEVPEDSDSDGWVTIGGLAGAGSLEGDPREPLAVAAAPVPAAAGTVCVPAPAGNVTEGEGEPEPASLASGPRDVPGLRRDVHLDPVAASGVALAASGAGPAVPEGMAAPAPQAEGDAVPVPAAPPRPSDPPEGAPGAVAVAAGNREGKRNREAPGDPLTRATAWMATQFGDDWRRSFHWTHRLSLAKPLVYCRRCVRHTESVQHLVGLARECTGDAPVASCYPSRRVKIERGLHPTARPERELEGPVPLPPGQKR